MTLKEDEKNSNLLDYLMDHLYDTKIMNKEEEIQKIIGQSIERGDKENEYVLTSYITFLEKEPNKFHIYKCETNIYNEINNNERNNKIKTIMKSEGTLNYLGLLDNVLRKLYKFNNNKNTGNGMIYIYTLKNPEKNDLFYIYTLKNYRTITSSKSPTEFEKDYINVNVIDIRHKQHKRGKLYPKKIKLYKTIKENEVYSDFFYPRMSQDEIIEYLIKNKKLKFFD